MKKKTAAHTPGPWVIRGSNRWGDLTVEPAAEPPKEITVANVPRQEDAALVAAAPEMLAALKAIEWAAAHEDGYNVCPFCSARYRKRGAAHRDTCIVGNAIAKAEGLSAQSKENDNG